jgi:hypothetical protein
LSKRGKREYVQVLRLLETFSMAEVTKAIEDALRMRAISFDAVKHLLLCRIEQRPPRLDLENYPHLPVAQVATTAATDYLELLTSTQEGEQAWFSNLPGLFLSWRPVVFSGLPYVSLGDASEKTAQECMAIEAVRLSLPPSPARKPEGLS